MILLTRCMILYIFVENIVYHTSDYFRLVLNSPRHNCFKRESGFPPVFNSPTDIESERGENKTRAKIS